MKNLFSYIVVCLFAYAAKAQQQTTVDIPLQISQAYSNRFPAAKTTKWERVGDQYIAFFTENGKSTCAYFSPGAIWIRTETYIRRKKDLPASIRQGLRNTAYAGWSIDSAVEVRTGDQSTVRLKVSEWYNYPEGQREVCRLNFTADGTLIDKEVLPITR